ncbi:DUF1150 domain-containing protein [Acuticoccus sp. MNP-M23]|uniref:BQ00720 family protein n=1 Tax=Acuticoccus sp. MNP-M23 TaxID=3072793 RepID=UPI00281679D4|nr:DUF1150 domain-containing protein [Acuticoccus sp. MNP-M23]WMS41118.1 DUF1150 domain-containing protein [Acuticoccus sp. MNP-M23]
MIESGKVSGRTSAPLISEHQLAALGEGHVAYVRQLRSEDVHDVFPEAPEMEPGQAVWALLSAAGAPIVLADTAQAILENAMENNLVTVSVH